MVVSKTELQPTNIRAYGIELEKVHNITYLGANVNDNWDINKEIRIRIEKGRAAFYKLKKILINRDITLNLKIRLIRCYTFSTLLYGMESWTLTETLMKRLEAFEMWIYRRVLRISWVDRIRNEIVLLRIKKSTEITKTIKIRKTSREV
ncbi:unnamed protein product [Diabrotica balteata]|uniref:Uncharacterized protein n=1 Tax=Diabrotica balteata TaxID=107213 RepID=A0A9N9SPW8_DIABA|nr:unnamed protein product [Diabrotica balteata]